MHRAKSPASRRRCSRRGSKSRPSATSWPPPSARPTRVFSTLTSCLLEDSSLIESVKEQVNSRLVNVDFAYEQVVRSYTRKMRELDDDYFRERAGDFLDVSRRVLRNLQGKAQAELHNLDTPSIVLAHDLSPSDTAGLDRKLVLGVATEAGSRTSHSAIMARSLNLPAVVGMQGADRQARARRRGADRRLRGPASSSRPASRPRPNTGPARAAHHDVSRQSSTSCARRCRSRSTSAASSSRPTWRFSTTCPRSRKTARRASACCAPNIFSSTRTNFPPRTQQTAMYREMARGLAAASSHHPHARRRRRQEAAPPRHRAGDQSLPRLPRHPLLARPAGTFPHAAARHLPRQRRGQCPHHVPHGLRPGRSRGRPPHARRGARGPAQGRRRRCRKRSSAA